MRRGLVSIFVLLAVSAFSLNVAAVPTSISYQGRLTDASGAPVSDAVYSVTFRIYEVSGGGGAVWSEVQSVTTAEGLFTVLLGAVTPMYPDLFEGPVKYLTMQVAAEAESSPRIPMVSVPYAMTAGSIQGGGTTDCSDCDAVFINAVGPEELRASVDTALKVTDTGAMARVGVLSRLETSTSDTVSAIRGVAVNEGSGKAQGGSFEASCDGGGVVHAINAQATNSSDSYTSMGVVAQARNLGAGSARGGYFEAKDDGTGQHIGVMGYSASSALSSTDAFGVLGACSHFGSGKSCGGRFTGYYGVQAIGIEALGSTNRPDSAFGTYSRAVNSSHGPAIGGVFAADSVGTGWKYGLLVKASGGAGNAKGVDVDSRSTSGGQAATGYYAWTAHSGSADAIGCDLVGNSSNGNGYGGRFIGVSNSRESYGVRTYGLANSSTGLVRGIYAMTYNNSGVSYSSYSYAGYFRNHIRNGGVAYGIYSIVDTLSSTSQCYGVYGRSEHFGTGTSYASYFLADSTGTGASYGARTVALTRGSATAYGVNSAVANRGTGTVYAGYFDVLNYGTGTRYAVYGNSPVSGYAGYFNGNVRVTGSQTVLGTKSAAVEVEPEDYRLVYSQESPECWFEDFGEGRLVNGRTHIELDPLFLRTVTIDEQHPMKVFIQLNDPDCNGTAVVRGVTGFEVVELMNGRGNASFSYRVVAKRRGYEDVRLAQMGGPTRREVEAEVERDRVALEADGERAAEAYAAQKESQRREEAEQEELARQLEERR